MIFGRYPVEKKLIKPTNICLECDQNQLWEFQEKCLGVNLRRSNLGGKFRGSPKKERMNE